MKTILGIDIGSSKTVAIIADIGEEPTITGVGITKTKGIRKGTITNLEQVSSSIKQAVNDAKRIAGVNVDTAIVSISGTYTKSIQSHGIINIPSHEITLSEIHRVIQTSLYNANLQQDEVILQAIPYNFKVNDISDVEDPEGMSGNRLEVDVHIIISPRAAVENLKKTFKMAGIKVENIVLNAFASAIATLNDEEREQGVALIDIGATTSDLIIIKENAIRWSEFVGVGSHHITNDLSMAIKTPISKAEEIKLNIAKFKDDDIVEVPIIGDDKTQSINIVTIKQIMYARINETLMILNKLIEDSKLKDSLSGIVLTGGFTNLTNLRETAIDIFGNMAVRVAKPKEINGLFKNLKSPEFSTAIGLILYSLGKHSSYEIDSNKKFRSKYKLEISSDELENDENIPANTLPSGEDGPLLKKDEVNFFQKIYMWVKDLF